MGRLRRWLVRAALVAVVAVGGAVTWCDGRVRAYLAGPPLGGALIYAAPTVLRVGAPVPGGSLVRKLTRLGYTAAAVDAPLAPGTFRSAAATV